MRMNHHPKTETLAAYAAGALDEARAVVVATHLALCGECRRAVRDFEAVGGDLLLAMEPAAMASDSLSRFWLRAGERETLRAGASAPASNDIDLTDARPLNRYLADGIEGVRWRKIVPGISDCVIAARGYRPGVLRLLKIEPGTRIPKHTHSGEEFTLILRGAYNDELGSFVRGDFVDLDDEDCHSPMAVGETPCICLIATNAPLVFKDLAGRIAQPFVGL
jgi:putative transcriptional regulator